MYGEWPTCFESLNYQGELFWTNLRDHRRQKRTRRSTRIKFKNLKSKIATSWKAFKRNDSLSLEKRIDNFSDDQSLNEANIDENLFENNSTNLPESLQPEMQKNAQNLSISRNSKASPLVSPFINNRLKNDKTIFSKLFGIFPSDNSTINIGLSSNMNLNSQDLFNTQNRRESLSETIKSLSSVTFKDLSNTKVSTSYPRNWKKVITEKYYQNPIYKIILSSDLKNFLKREPLTQQLTTVQEKELNFLRIKMCHYFDTLRFYFKMKEKIKPYLESTQNSTFNKIQSPALSVSSKSNSSMPKEEPQENKIGRAPHNNLSVNSTENLRKLKTTSQIGLKNLPFQFKSMTSLNYHQRFKGSLKPIRELFQISLPNSISFDKSLFNEFAINHNSFFHEELSKNQSSKTRVFASKDPSRTSSPLHTVDQHDNEIQDRVGGLKNQKIRNESLQSKTRAPKENFNDDQRERISNLFGSNDPFYVGWDKNLRKFILTSRFLSRPSSLNEQIQIPETKTLPSSKDQTSVSFQSEILPKSSKANSVREPQFDENSEKKTGHKKIRDNQFNLYRTYASWPFFRHQSLLVPSKDGMLPKTTERLYSFMYENYFNILNKNLRTFHNINLNNIDKKSLSFLYTYSLTDPKNKKLVSQLPQNIYKLAMQPTSSQDLFGPFQNSWTWPGSSFFSREYLFQGSQKK
nr:hypothetical chloroplast RF1 [Trentepohlia sp. YN1317]